jgi:hypothetical protein
VLALAALLLTAAAQPPAAYVDTGTAHVPLAITSWCWDTRCGAPLGQAGRRVVVARGAPVRVELKIDPVEATVSVGGEADDPRTGGQLDGDTRRRPHRLREVPARLGHLLRAPRAPLENGSADESGRLTPAAGLAAGKIAVSPREGL